MMMGSTEILELLAQRSGYILWEKAFPRGELKNDVFSLKEADGRDIVIIKNGAAWQPVLPLETFNDFCRASFIWQDGSDDQPRIIFRLTADGLARGLHGKR